jgi:quercetin dioxygenase-like cupin family protein
MHWLMEDAIADGANLSLAKMTVDPGATSDPHRHPNCTEAIHLLFGTVKQRAGDDWVVMRAGDTVLIREGITHQTRNTGSEIAILMIAYSTGSRVYEATP